MRAHEPRRPSAVGEATIVEPIRNCRTSGLVRGEIFARRHHWRRQAPQIRQAVVNDAQEITRSEGLLYARDRPELGRHVEEIRRVFGRRSHLVT